MFVLCLGKRRDHSGRYRQYPAFVPTKSLQNLCFIGRAWPKFPSFYSTYQKNPNKNHPQVRPLSRFLVFWELSYSCRIKRREPGSCNQDRKLKWTQTTPRKKCHNKRGKRGADCGTYSSRMRPSSTLMTSTFGTAAAAAEQASSTWYIWYVVV